MGVVYIKRSRKIGISFKRNRNIFVFNNLYIIQIFRIFARKHMSLGLILDKSSFQMLSFDEIILLHNYFIPNICPILVMEVLGDLKKEVGTESYSKERVIDFSRKLLPYHSAVNVNYQRLISEELIGNKIPFDNRPLLGNVTPVQAADGQKGLHIDVSQEEKAINRWKEGDFTTIDEITADVWRAVTTEKDILVNLKEKLKDSALGEREIKKIEDLCPYVDEILNDENKQSDLLSFIISEFSIDTSIAGNIFLRWEQSECKSINEFAPYTFFCCRVKLIFNLVLKNELFGGVRPTNLLDLEYLYYLPFCYVFSSNDKFHKRMIPLVIGEHHTFISGEELKADLKNLVSYRSTLSEKKDIERTQREPPQIPTSLIYQLWAKYFNWPNKQKREVSDKEFEAMKKKMDEMIDASENGNTTNTDNPDFIVKKHWMRPTDLCPCGSGKQLKDCHLKSNSK